MRARPVEPGGGLGDAYVDALFAVYSDRAPAGADFVCYWFAKAAEALRAGLVATKWLKAPPNRTVGPTAMCSNRGSVVSICHAACAACGSSISAGR
jgi:hypothetical protein